MRAKAIWTQGAKTGNWSATFRGIGIVIRIDPKTEKPTEISWYLNGKLTESAPVICSLEVAKQIAVKVVDHEIETDAHWAHSEYRHNSDIWKKQ
jgi:hypothetical protein